jgi:hypothetical protein
MSDPRPNPPGLIRREIVHQDASTVTIRETWDTTVPGCPFIAIDRATFEIDRSLKSAVHQFPMRTGDYVRLAAKSRAEALEAAINRFRECGVEIERFSIMDLENGLTHLCVDGVPRFSWRWLGMWNGPERRR